MSCSTERPALGARKREKPQLLGRPAARKAARRNRPQDVTGLCDRALAPARRPRVSTRGRDLKSASTTERSARPASPGSRDREVLGQDGRSRGLPRHGRDDAELGRRAMTTRRIFRGERRSDLVVGRRAACTPREPPIGRCLRGVGQGHAKDACPSPASPARGRSDVGRTPAAPPPRPRTMPRPRRGGPGTAPGGAGAKEGDRDAPPRPARRGPGRRRAAAEPRPPRQPRRGASHLEPPPPGRAAPLANRTAARRRGCFVSMSCGPKASAADPSRLQHAPEVAGRKPAPRPGP